MVRLVALLEPAQDGDGVLDRGLADEDLLEAALEGGVLLDVLAVLVEGGRADQAQLAAGEQRLEHVAGIHGALAGGAGADDGVQLVDERDDLAVAVLDLLEDGLEPLLELAAVLRAGDHRAEVEADEPLVAQRLRHVAVDDALGQPLDDGGLADAGLADEDGVVLGAARQHLHDPADLGVAADDRVELAVAGGLGEVGAVLLQRLGGGLGVLGGDLVAAAQHGDLRLDRLGVGADRALLDQGEQQDVGGQVRVAHGLHQGRVLQHGERLLARAGGLHRAPEVRGSDRGRAGRRPRRPRRTCPPPVSSAAGRRVGLLGEREREVGRGDLGVAAALRLTLARAERLPHLGGGLELHAEVSCGRGGLVRSTIGQS